MLHVDRQTRDQVEAKIRWVTYVNPTDVKDFAHGVCDFGDYIAVVGEARFEKSFLVLLRKIHTYPFLVLLRKSDGGVVKRWIGSENGSFYECISIGGKLYVVGTTMVGNHSYGVIYVFDENLNVLAKVKSESPSGYSSLAYDGKALYISGVAYEGVDVAGIRKRVGLIEKRALDTSLFLVNSTKIYFDSWKTGDIGDIGVDPSTGRIWAVGRYFDSNNTGHSLIVIFDGDLRVLKVIDYPRDSRGYLGVLYGIAFDGRYAYILGSLGVAKFSVEGELVAISIDLMALLRFRPKIVYGYNYLYIFGGDSIEGYDGPVLYIHDTDLNLVKRYVLSENPSHFAIGKPALEGNNIYVAGFDYALCGPNSRIVVYSLSIESAAATATTPVATATTATITIPITQTTTVTVTSTAIVTKTEAVTIGIPTTATITTTAPVYTTVPTTITITVSEGASAQLIAAGLATIGVILAIAFLLLRRR